MQEHRLQCLLAPKPFEFRKSHSVLLVVLRGIFLNRSIANDCTEPVVSVTYRRVLLGGSLGFNIAGALCSISQLLTTTDIEQVRGNRRRNEVSCPYCIAKFKPPSAVCMSFSYGYNPIPHEETSRYSHVNLFMNPELKSESWPVQPKVTFHYFLKII